MSLISTLPKKLFYHRIGSLVLIAGLKKNVDVRFGIEKKKRKTFWEYW